MMFYHKYNKYTKNRAIKKGDTLIEVTLAVGIFSMVAVAVLAVMNGSASSAQTALEATLTREEIDAQADALRFIHSAYVADKDKNQGKDPTTPSSIGTNFAQLWGKLKENAITTDQDKFTETYPYPPASCDALYTNLAQQAFILNTRSLGAINSDSFNIDDIFISAGASSSKFIPTTTYPHLYYADNDYLVANFAQNTLQNSEGLYIIGVASDEKDPELNEHYYYDFYIRSCWYGIGDRDSAPSTISTVMRLYNPDVIKPSSVTRNTSSSGDELAGCQEETTSYIMVDTNMYIGDGEGGESFEYKGEENIDVYFRVENPRNSEKYNSDGLRDEYDQQCLDKNSPGLLGVGEVNISTKTYDWTSNSYKCQGSLVSLQARSGQGGDLWYPAQVGDTLIVTIKSDEYQLYFEDVNNDDSYSEGTEGTKNPYLCDADKGVTCKYRHKGEYNYTTIGRDSDNTNIEDIIDDIEHNDRVDEINAFGNADEFIITIPISKCAINTTAENYGEYARFYSGFDGVITINTSWKRK